MDKRSALIELGKLRRSSRWDGYANLGDYYDGAYECDFVSPYTKTAGNVDSQVFILLQDWSSDGFLKGDLDLDASGKGYTPSLPTNRNLEQLLRRVFRLEIRDTYGTNLFPFIKMGGMSASIAARDLIRAANEFALPQIEVVRPRVVICLGLVTFNAVRRACNEASCANINEAIRSPFSFRATRIWCQAHTGALGRFNRNRGGIDRVSSDWADMRADFDSFDRG